MSRTQYIKRRKTNRENTIRLHMKTEDFQSIQKQPCVKFYSPSQDFIRNHQPFLQNTKIHFNVRTNRTILSKRHNFSEGRPATCKEPHRTRQDNIEKLKREIKELDQQDFISFRSKNYGVDEIRTESNEKIKNYNTQNSLLVEFKAKLLNNSQINKCRNMSQNSSVPKKYYSKPSINLQQNQENVCLRGEKINIQNLNASALMGCNIQNYWMKKNIKNRHFVKKRGNQSNINTKSVYR